MIRVLVAEDSSVDAALLQAVCAAEGYRVTVVGNGEEAVAAFAAAGADLVVLDACMPGMDGYAAAARIRELMGSRWIPMIFLSAMDDSAAIVRGLEAGADDFIVKPVDQAVLRAKLRVFAHASLDREAIDRYRNWKAHEAELATAVLEHVMGSPHLTDAAVHHRTESATEFSGDLVLARRAPGGNSYVLVADAVGHGLAATLCVLPLVRVFSTMTARDLAVADIVTEMNLHLRELLPTGYYVAASVLAIDHARARIELWNGGLPPALLVTGGAITAELPSRHPPLGVLEPAALDAGVECLDVTPGSHLVLYSDGLTEAADAAGEAFGPGRLRATLGAASPTAEIAGVFAALQDFSGAAAPHDDVTVVVAGIG
ncbi:MAG: PP2C family protein-serine/threonine phosphatase [Gammaproteobacteria bacterium]